MDHRPSKLQTAITLYFPMFIAALSLITAIYNGFLNNRFVDLIQNNIARVEYLRTCKEAIDSYFQVKFRAGLIASAARNGSAPANGLWPEQVDGENAVNKFAALGTYLANLRNEAVRVRYTQLSDQLEKIMIEARSTPAGEIGKLFEASDHLFAEMNDDCVKSAKAAALQ